MRWHWHEKLMPITSKRTVEKLCNSPSVLTCSEPDLVVRSFSIKKGTKWGKNILLMMMMMIVTMMIKINIEIIKIRELQKITFYRNFQRTEKQRTSPRCTSTKLHTFKDTISWHIALDLRTGNPHAIFSSFKGILRYENPTSWHLVNSSSPPWAINSAQFSGVSSK